MMDDELYTSPHVDDKTNISGPQADRIRKHFHAIFKRNGLDLEIECNLKIVNYLDITLNLENGTYQPYHKPNDETIYIHAKSNHPTNIIKQLPLSVEKRLSTLSANENIFKESAKHYQEALNKFGYIHKLQYISKEKPMETTGKKRKKRKKCAPYNQITGKCNLCLSEKLEIIEENENKNLLNKRDELVSRCVHQVKYKLCCPSKKKLTS